MIEKLILEIMELTNEDLENKHRKIWVYYNTKLKYLTVSLDIMPKDNPNIFSVNADINYRFEKDIIEDLQFVLAVINKQSNIETRVLNKTFKPVSSWPKDEDGVPF